MDIFLEYLMQKKPDKKDAFKKLGLILLGLVGCYLVLLLVAIFPVIQPVAFLGIAAVVYGVYVLMRNMNVEYEYIFTNGELDIDIIYGKKTRKRLVNLACKQIRVLASDENESYRHEFQGDHISKQFDAVYDRERGGIYHALFTFDGEAFVLHFQPSKKLLAEMWKFNPRAVYIEDQDTLETE